MAFATAEIFLSTSQVSFAGIHFTQTLLELGFGL
jgi:hypothetical protein